MTSLEIALIKKICKQYAYDDLSSRQSISEDNSISKSKVTKYLHLGITENIVNDETAKLIAQKAISRVWHNYGDTRKIKEVYRELFKKREECILKSTVLTPEEIAQREIYRDHILATFNDTYSDGDEFPLSPENLEDQIDGFVGLPK